MPLLLDTDNDSDDAVRDDDDTVWDNGSAIVHAHGHDGKSIIMQSSDHMILHTRLISSITDGTLTQSALGTPIAHQTPSSLSSPISRQTPSPLSSPISPQTPSPPSPPTTNRLSSNPGEHL